MAASKTHKQFVTALKKLAEPSAVAEVSRFFHADPNARSSDNKILSVSIGRIFPVAKQFADLPLADIETLLESPYYEIRMGAVSVMDFQEEKRKKKKRRKKGSGFTFYPERRKKGSGFTFYPEGDISN